LGDSEIFSGLEEYIEDNKEAVEGLESSIETNAGIQKDSRFRSVAQYSGYDSSNIKDMQSIYDELKNSGAWADEKELRSYLASSDISADYATWNNAVNAINKVVGADSSQNADDLMDELSGLSKTDRAAFNAI
jgi:hypothetical protein